MTQTAEILPMETGAIAIYTPFRSQLAEMKKQNSTLIFDYESKAGNEAARSYVWKLRQTKSAVEEARKKEKQESLDYGRKVDAEAKEITGEIESMITVHQTVLDEIKHREDERVRKIRQRIDGIIELGKIGILSTNVGILQAQLAAVKKAPVDESMAEFLAEAIKERDAAIEKLEAAIIDMQKRAAEQEELERLRKEAVDRQKKDNEDRIAAEAAANAKAEAEQSIIRIQLEKDEALKKAEDARIAAEEKAQRDIDAATKAERDRIERERIADADALAKREADTAHRAKINNEALNAIIGIMAAGDLNDASLAKSIIAAIAKGEIPHIKILY